MSDITGPLTTDQAALVAAVWKACTACGQWPIYQYLEAGLQNDGLSALATLHSFPTAKNETYGSAGGYAAVFYQRNGMASPDAGSKVSLTIAGLRHVADDGGLTAHYLGLVRYIAAKRAAAPYSPTQVINVAVSRADVLKVLPDDDERLTQIFELASHEPATWSGMTSSPEAELWWSEAGPHVRDFQGVADAEDYLARVIARIQRPTVPPPRPAASPRSLVAALDYLDAIWQGRFHQPLVQLESAESAAKLALPVTNVDEFDGALSALADVLGHLRVPDRPTGEDQHPITRLGQFLPPKLKQANPERIAEALNNLNRIKTVRHGVQHAKARPKGADALAELGIGFPVSDWAWAWEMIKFHAVNALDAIREEIQASRRANA